MQKNKLTLLRRELAHVRSSGRLSFYRATARDRVSFAHEVAWRSLRGDSPWPSRLCLQGCMAQLVRRQPVTEWALLTRLHGLCSITRQIRRFLGAPASLATCFMQRKLSPKSKNVACTQKTSIPNATQSLKSAKKSCFCVVIRLKTSQNKKKLQPFPPKNIKKVAWRTSTEFLQNLTFPHCNITSNDLILSYVNLVRVFSLCLFFKTVIKKGGVFRIILYRCK